MTRIARLRKVVEDHQAALIDGFWVDVQTASAMVKVWDGLSAANREKFERLSLMRLVDFTWKHVKVTGFRTAEV